MGHGFRDEWFHRATVAGRGCVAGAGDFVCVDEPREHAAAVREDSVYGGTSGAIGDFAGMERAARGADIFCGIWVSDYGDVAAAVGIVLPSEFKAILLDAFCAHR